MKNEERAHDHKNSDTNSVRARLKKAAPTMFSVARSQDRKAAKNPKSEALKKKTGTFDTASIREKHANKAAGKRSLKASQRDHTGDPYYENR